jgi:hypothetical protein
VSHSSALCLPFPIPCKTLHESTKYSSDLNDEYTYETDEFRLNLLVNRQQTKSLRNLMPINIIIYIPQQPIRYTLFSCNEMNLYHSLYRHYSSYCISLTTRSPPPPSHFIPRRDTGTLAMPFLLSLAPTITICFVIKLPH